LPSSTPFQVSPLTIITAFPLQNQLISFSLMFNLIV
jgi:hypothetical protein